MSAGAGLNPGPRNHLYLLKPVTHPLGGLLLGRARPGPTEPQCHKVKGLVTVLLGKTRFAAGKFTRLALVSDHRCERRLAANFPLATRWHASAAAATGNNRRGRCPHSGKAEKRGVARTQSYPRVSAAAKVVEDAVGMTMREHVREGWAEANAS
jgi:hypothetical protein